MLWAIGVIAEILIFLNLPKVFARFSYLQLWVISFAVTVVRYLIVAWFPQVLALQILAQAMHMFTFGTFMRPHSRCCTTPSKVACKRAGRDCTPVCRSAWEARRAALSAAIPGRIGEPAWTFTLSSALALAGLVLVLLRPQALLNANRRP